jgi:hypothetical protein
MLETEKGTTNDHTSLPIDDDEYGQQYFQTPKTLPKT